MALERSEYRVIRSRQVDLPFYEKFGQRSFGFQLLDALMSVLACHAAVRIFPPSSTDRWRAVNLYTKVDFSCAKLTVMVLIAFMGNEEPNKVMYLLRERYEFDSNIIDTCIDQLKELKLLVPPDDLSHQNSMHLCREWSKYGWVDTADYQLATWDYPFADYARDGREIDFQRMKSYVNDEPDIERAKRYPDIIRRTQIGSTTAALNTLNDPFSYIWSNDPILNTLTKKRCETLIASVFGVLRRRVLSDSPEIIADAIGKTSPSGGSRHPAECYLFACAVTGLEPGIYHFNMEDESLDAIGDLDVDSESLFEMFSGPMRASFKIDAFIVMTSVFERSMWRYREPRSFRAIYMDVGHLCATLDIVAKTLGLNCLVQHGLSESPIAQRLKIHPLTEGVIYGAAIGGSKAGGAC